MNIPGIQIQQCKDIIVTWQTDGDINASVCRIPDTGPNPVNYGTLTNPLGRVPVGVQIIKKNKIVDVVVLSADPGKIYVLFTADHADINLRIW